MPRYAFVNGQYVRHHNAAIHIEDRGFQFADGVYEVISCIHGVLADERGHLDRLGRSLRELQIDMPVSPATLRFIMRELLRRNRLKNAAVYIQVTRGAAKRDFKFPKDAMPTLVLTTWPFNFENGHIDKGVKAVTVPDQRWARRDIKTVGLLPQSLAKQKAAHKGAFEAWMIDEKGFVTEGSSSNAFIVKGKTLQTRPANNEILKGVTRTAIEHICKEHGMTFSEKPFKPADALKADEAFNTSATALVVPVVKLDGKNIGNGKSGPVTKALYEYYRAYVNNLKGKQYKWKA